MSAMFHLPTARLGAVLALVAGVVPGHVLDAQGPDKRPSLALKVTPQVAFAPAKVVVRAEIRGGPDDYQELYCPTVEWVWDDGTTSENSADCEPYEAGKSQIRRRFSAEHTYRNAGQFRVVLRLKKGGRVVGMGNVVLQVRPGPFGDAAPR
jgi:hypothetical protein